MVHRRKPSLSQNNPHIGGSIWHSEGLLRCAMTLLQGPKDPVLPNLMYICILKLQNKTCRYILNENRRFYVGHFCHADKIDFWEITKYF